MAKADPAVVIFLRSSLGEIGTSCSGATALLSHRPAASARGATPAKPAVMRGKLSSVAGEDRSGKLVAGRDPDQVSIGGRGDRLPLLAVRGAQDRPTAPDHPAYLRRWRSAGKQVVRGAAVKGPPVKAVGRPSDDSPGRQPPESQISRRGDHDRLVEFCTGNRLRRGLRLRMGWGRRFSRRGWEGNH